VLANAASIEEVFSGLEGADLILRIDPDHQPTMFRGATVTHAEIDALRRIEHVVRAGRVLRIEPDTIVLEHGVVPTAADRLHVDCSAAGVRNRPGVPVFDGDRITLQYLVFGGHPTFSSAITAHVEVACEGEAEKNELCRPIPFSGDAADIPRFLLADLRARRLWARTPQVSEWNDRSRLSPMAGVVDRLDLSDAATLAILERTRENLRPARVNLERLLGDAATV
jgi:hypothetical protein